MRHLGALLFLFTTGGLGERIGSLAPGYEADVIAVQGDPLHDIGALEKVVFVMKRGRVLKSRLEQMPDPR